MAFLYNYDEEAGLLGAKDAYAFAFAEREVRQGFVRKVLGLLGVQLLITAAVTALFIFSQPVKTYVFTAQWPFWTAFAVSLVLILALSFSESLRRNHPLNLFVLAGFTLCEAMLVGTVSAMYDTKVVLLAVGITTAVVLGCALFATQSRVDLTMANGFLMSLLLAVFTASLLNLVIRAPWLYVGICIAGVVLFSLYLVFDLQLLMGGHKYALSPDEYVFAALSLYLDIINIFLYLLQLLGSQDRS
ncbi:hypothetical protein VOLCADRAFT_82555 [Volvox carteri f. nagariensis]|uniref:Uncharacterized protein n=1 Tax=Volvox carteri f. nagariensis TaxID=3068 RepID=D8U5M9_VOLCA|nr:uncharacterized protein VOLCADRAFT_82555 [Volvox carteri f. nagariensis]EFJ44946.1 hypothetical protein VOLCADRAFT_82555 [Volvox carteri f. nagariensis]|eukprot:XP_002953917.1 hypothetical protein VOLCADRAFT_82555 [Volvox carteri f. nagariensis]